MTKLKLFHIKNEMLFANGLANFIGVFLVNSLMIKSSVPLPADYYANSFAKVIDMLFTPLAFVFVVIITLLYEKPIRQYLNMKFNEISIPYDLNAIAQRRVINEPFVLIAFDLSMWLLSATVFSSLHWLVESGSYWISRSIFFSVSTGLITVTGAFFFMEHILQKKLAPLFFPHGRLCDVPQTLRIKISTRLIALLLACNCIPLLLMMYAFHNTAISPQDIAGTLKYMRTSIYINGFWFIGIGVFLTMLVSRNLATPFEEILSTLKNIRNGIFDNEVRVTSNDEIGYTADVINEMSRGLQERELIKDTFGKYVAKEIRDEVLSGRIPLDGEKKEVTVIFSDLRNFTPMTELNDPKLVVKIMNHYFAEMSEAIQNQGGLVLQFIGDEIYAVFGAPLTLHDHPARAFRAGLDMSHRLVKLNREFHEKGWPVLQHGIGVHTGQAIAANIGSPDRLSYLLIGDTINLASRLQTLTKEIGSEMIISSSTHDRLGQSLLSEIKLSKLSSMSLKGKTQPVDIYVFNQYSVN